MDTERARQKLQDMDKLHEKSVRFVRHTERQQKRLDRIAQLLHMTTDEAREVVELILEYLNGTGAFKQGTLRITKKHVT